MTLEFVEATHTYLLDDIEVPHVTKLIRECGLVDFSMIDAETLDNACEFGKHCHSMTELWDKGELSIPSVHTELVPYLEGWMRFREETAFVPELVEVKVASRKYQYAGTVDRIGLLKKRGREVRVILDIKTGTVTGPDIGVQTAAYFQAHNEECREIGLDAIAQARCSVTLVGKGNYKLDWWESEEDWSTFLACLKIHNWKRRNHVRTGNHS